jgi:hypothetical protein
MYVRINENPVMELLQERKIWKKITIFLNVFKRCINTLTHCTYNSYSEHESRKRPKATITCCRMPLSAALVRRFVLRERETAKTILIRSACSGNIIMRAEDGGIGKLEEG